uniref:Uncharacterized protein n=1 Tax=Meloidogyne enterolobii TaxID=390850 RepID=A0A6V7XLA2_MELEN|nr:unnamed protein product [Meloidogyne enterolobii]
MIRRRKIQVKPNQCLSKPKNNEEENEDKSKRSKGEESTTTTATTVETTIIPIIFTSSNTQTNTTTEIIVPQLSQEDQLNRQQTINCEETSINNSQNSHNVVSTTSSLETIIVTSTDYSRGINTVVNVNSNISVLQLPESFDRNVPESVVHEKQTSNNRIHLPPLLSSSRTSQQQQNTYNSYCNLSESYGSPQKLDKSDSTLSEKRSRERPKEKLCDTKKFTMADLVKWRPKTENTFRKKWSTKRKNDEEEKASILSKTDESADDLSTSKSLTPKKGINIDEEKGGETANFRA